ncbi:MAG TPA: carbamoyl-phosphate synthase large subunit [Polyangia bacterium]|nr:carbamoyl-phosphate synthase large subunit [Polyangia bacterium]
MPKRNDIHKILLIGSGPIVIGQACEFDYSGTQGVRALRAEGFEVVLVNSNPATIMTDPELAERTYVEPLLPEVIERVIERERPDALLPTLGGQTALNMALELAARGVLDKYGVKLIGAAREAIEKAEDRDLFKAAMARIGLEVPRSGYARSVAEAREILKTFGFPAILRPSFTLGGMGGGIAYHDAEFDERVAWALAQSPRGQVLVEESVLGWKEYELEVMRDRHDNVVVICSIENLDPMGVHTGDSITVAPAMTLTDKEYQRMRDAAAAVIREIGVETGGSNVQFAVNPEDGRMVVVEMNPRVSRSSALASKATGFPIAKIAAKLAVGYTLDEIRNDITRETPASFEPTIDYVVVKVPRFAFEKFPGADATLTTQMKSVGEVMAIGRTFREALGKAIRSLEIGRAGFDLEAPGLDELRKRIGTPTAERLFLVAEALRQGMTVAEAFDLTKIDPWFLTHIERIVTEEGAIAGRALDDLDEATLWRAKANGLSDRRLAALTSSLPDAVRARRLELGVTPVYKRVDTCAAEFRAHTPYLYSTYEPPIFLYDGVDGKAQSGDEAEPTTRKKVMILGGGPNRIGQGIEFDYCCVHAVQARREEGYETIMVNCNPETVSTDYDTSDRLYFEPLTREDVLAICDLEKPDGVIVQFGGQTPLRLAVGLKAAGVRLLGTSADAIDRAEDRQRFGEVIEKLGLKAPPYGTARTVDEALSVARRIGLPVVVRPSYVLGGRAMEVVHDLDQLAKYVARAMAAQAADDEKNPVLIDRFLSDAIEVDVDAVSDGKRTVIGAVMEHIEEAGIHSGDSACALPPYSLAPAVIEKISSQVRALAAELGVVGLMNAQFAVKGDEVYLLEVNPRASRTVPFVSKVTGQPLAKIAARVMIGRTLDELGAREIVPAHVAVKEAVFPFVKFPGTDTLLGPEMRSTGEVMGIDRDFPLAFAKAQLGAGTKLPTRGKIFISVRDEDKPASVEVARKLTQLGFGIVATHGTAAFFAAQGVPAEGVNKVLEGHPHCVDALQNGDIALVINTTTANAQAIRDSFSIRRTALIKDVPYFTTIAAAKAAALGIAALGRGALDVRALQEYHPQPH